MMTKQSSQSILSTRLMVARSRPTESNGSSKSHATSRAPRSAWWTRCGVMSATPAPVSPTWQSWHSTSWQATPQSWLSQTRFLSMRRTPTAVDWAHDRAPTWLVYAILSQPCAAYTQWGLSGGGLSSSSATAQSPCCTSWSLSRPFLNGALFGLHSPAYSSSSTWRQLGRVLGPMQQKPALTQPSPCVSSLSTSGRRWRVSRRRRWWSGRPRAPSSSLAASLPSQSSSYTSSWVRPKASASVKRKKSLCQAPPGAEPCAMERLRLSNLVRSISQDAHCTVKELPPSKLQKQSGQVFKLKRMRIEHLL